VSAAEPVREETRGAARVLTVARPEKKNALDRAAVEALASAIERASDEPAVRAVVLAAEGDVFLAGADLEDLARLVGQPGAADAVLAMGERLDAIERCRVPVIAAVTGDVFGGGCEIVLGCDEAIVEEGVRLAFRHARMGLCPAWGGSGRLVERAGAAAAARWLFTAEPFGADEALRLGVASEVVPAGGAVARAEARAAAIARADRDVIEAQRRMIRSSRGAAEARRLEAETFRRLWGGPAHLAAMEAFARRPR
jgi:enoyl-CoA hydratase